MDEEEEEIGLDVMPCNNIVPYSNDPEQDSIHSISEESEDAEENGRDAIHEWCFCECCTQMDTFREGVCCYDLDICRERKVEAVTIYGLQTHFDCITEHPGFRYNCLVWEMLDNAWLAYRQQYGNTAYENNNIHKRRRHVAYRQLARFLYGIVGRQNRYVLPSCAVRKILESFSNDREEQYAGFIDVFD